ncbi:hypothetical protein BD413DRAFT_247162 [Trametes elegans]|nr:hypothetical protein BD413DRAFT_247162 [Trametes elegans]
MQHTYKMYRACNREGWPSLHCVLFEDGSIYFAVLFFFNLCDIIFLQVAINGAFADFVTVLSAILVSRFLLRLRDVSTAEQSGRDSRTWPDVQDDTSVLFFRDLQSSLRSTEEGDVARC